MGKRHQLPQQIQFTMHSYYFAALCCQLMQGMPQAVSLREAWEQVAHHGDELLAFVKRVVCVHEDAFCLGLKVLLPLLGIHTINLRIIFVTQQAVAQMVHSSPAQLKIVMKVCT